EKDVDDVEMGLEVKEVIVPSKKKNGLKRKVTSVDGSENDEMLDTGDNADSSMDVAESAKSLPKSSPTNVVKSVDAESQGPPKKIRKNMIFDSDSD
ncbi:UNVERIFIED_CONTAM: hypothetical protein HDU68_001306, partial [Siphonaria sp. JEL0065]